MTTESARDHRTGPRRRGSALVDAIHAAVLAEVAEHGYPALTMERVAERARASKASLYRRWPDVPSLVHDAVRSAMPAPEDVPDTGSLRGDLLAALRLVAERMEGAAGAAMRGLLAETLRDEAVAAEVRALGRGNGVRYVGAVVERAVRRGEVRADAVTAVRLEVGAALVRQRAVLGGGALDGAYLEQVVDEVLLPLFRASTPPQAAGRGSASTG